MGYREIHEYGERSPTKLGGAPERDFLLAKQFQSK